MSPALPAHFSKLSGQQMHPWKATIRLGRRVENCLGNGNTSINSLRELLFPSTAITTPRYLCNYPRLQVKQRRQHPETLHNQHSMCRSFVNTQRSLATALPPNLRTLDVDNDISHFMAAHNRLQHNAMPTRQTLHSTFHSQTSLAPVSSQNSLKFTREASHCYSNMCAAHTWSLRQRTLCADEETTPRCSGPEPTLG